MSDEAYRKLAKVLDTLPNGFPETQSGIEIAILKKIYDQDEAELFCDLRLAPETAAQISERTGRPLDGLEDKLKEMAKKGELWAAEVGGGTWVFKMVPWIVGIYEFQLKRMDREFAMMTEEYSRSWGRQFLSYGPQIMQVVPIEKEIPVKQEALTFQQVSGLIEAAKSYVLHECICKKKQGLLGEPCSKPTEVCLGMSPVPGAFKNTMSGRGITKEEAYEVLRKSEEAGLVHLTSNIESGHWFICNCCGCCCGVLRAAWMGMPNVVNSHYYAEIDPDLCTGCGLCVEERCQVKAIKKGEEHCSVITRRCIGCGLCASTCPEEAVRMVRKKPEECVSPPRDEGAWLDERARRRGVDYSKYK